MPEIKSPGAIACILLVACLVISGLVLAGCGEKAEREVVFKETTVEKSTPADESEDEDTAVDSTDEEDAVGDESEQKDIESATEAAKESARSQNQSLENLEVLDVKIVSGWATVVLEPVDKSTDAATWLLKKSGGIWTVVDFGTAILPENYPDAPAELLK